MVEFPEGKIPDSVGKVAVFNPVINPLSYKVMHCNVIITNTNVKLSFISLLKSPRFLWLENLLGQNNSMRYYADGLCDCKRSGIQQVAHQLTFFICVQLAVDI